MMTYQEVFPAVQEKLGLTDRFNHTLEVVKIAELLANKYHADIEKVKIAAILHDVTKYDAVENHQLLMKSHFNNDDCIHWPKPIWHALSAVIYAKDTLGITDVEILNAIKYHTTGRPNMSLIEKIIFVADFIEPTRKFDNSIFRNAAFNDLDLAVFMILKSQNDYLISIGEIPVSVETEALMYFQNIMEEQNVRNLKEDL